VDKEVNESNKTFESNLRKKYDFKEKETEPGGDPSEKTDPNDIAAMVKSAIADAVKPLQDELNGYRANALSDSRLKQLNEILGGCKDEAFKAKALKDFGRMTFNDDEAFNEFLTDTKTDVESANQRVADSNLSSESRPFFANKGDDGVSKGVAEFVESQKPGSDTFTGKQV